MKPRIFVASSSESLEIAYALQSNLDADAEVTVWSQGVFVLSSNTLDDLIKVAGEFDFGLFVFSPEDIVKIRDRQFLATRDNVIFELGLFIGRLGKERNFLVVPVGRQDFHLPTDLIGINLATFNLDRLDGNLQAALGPASNQIRKTLQRISSVKRTPKTESEKLIGVIRRIVELQQPAYSDVQINDWKMIHSIDDKGNGFLREEFTLVPATGPLYFFLIENSISKAVDAQSGIRINAEALTSGMPLTVLEIKRSDIHVNSVIILDPPATVENPQRVALNCERPAIWRDLIEDGEVQGFLRSSNKSNLLHIEFLAPPGKDWKSFNPAPTIGNIEIDSSGDRSRIVWTIPNPPLRRYSYKLYLN
jgi:Predicted nucleotide-binding protein containing TIR -like domain